jgi:hypothetical protein
MRVLSPSCLVGGLTVLWTSGCGGKVLELDADGRTDAAVSDARAISERAPDFDTGPRNSCPASAPRAGQVCSPSGFLCEYDVSQPNPHCNSLWECPDSGVWQNLSDTTGCPAPGPPCPDSYADVPVNEACPAKDQVCVYPTGSCGCAPQPDDGTPTWQCEPLPPDCPMTFPALGTTCVTPGLVCPYSPCGGGAAFRCQEGVWQELGADCLTTP